MRIVPLARSVVALLGLVVLSGCLNSGLPAPGASFTHEVSSPPQPWPHEKFDVAQDKFTFAIISDLNGGERDGVFNVAVAQLELLRPEFIISVGDLIDGGTEDTAQLKKEWDSFDERAAAARAPLFYVGGNHDLSNLAMRAFWEERYGPRYYHFIYKDVLFLVMDTEDYSEQRMDEIYQARAAALKVLYGGEEKKARAMEYFQLPERLTGEIGAEQAAYFEDVIANNPDVRWTMMFMHKPVWMREGDNAFTRIEDALSDRPYTLFNGHFHRYAHTTRKNRDYIMLGTTGGGQSADTDAAFDHITLVTMDDDGPAIATLRMDGILDKTAIIPAGGEDLCFQASRCATTNE